MKAEKTSASLIDTALIIFVRFPSPGKVKSRLAESLGENTASAFYRECAEKIFNECRLVGGGVKSYIFYSDRRDAAAVKGWAGPWFHFSAQYDGDLGERIEHALREVFGSGARQVIIMASDVPDLSTEIINDAVSSLADYDIVVGPSFDGGYYLLGMKRLHEKLFNDISWSTGKVLQQTVDIAERLGLTIKRMPALRDIDTIQDLREWMETAADTGNPLVKIFQDKE